MFINGNNKQLPCRDCGKLVSSQAFSCPECGCPFPYKKEWSGWGFEYKSDTSVLGFPLLHISFKYRADRIPVPARGVIAIGQFACGVFTISQFGIGVVSLSQFTVAVFAIAQFAAAWSLIAQIGVYVDKGYGQLVWKAGELLSLLF